jgi:hypothetical protein
MFGRNLCISRRITNIRTALGISTIAAETRVKRLTEADHKDFGKISLDLGNAYHCFDYVEEQKLYLIADREAVQIRQEQSMYLHSTGSLFGCPVPTAPNYFGKAMWYR